MTVFIFQLLVVSAETIRGGEAVNRLRSETNLSALDVHCIELVELSQTCEHKEMKISSSNHRIDMLGARIREPHLTRPNVPPLRPYIIGMIGGIASGKSDMSARFAKLGAKVIDCDKLAHQLYEPNEECYEDIVTCFGKAVLDEAGRIDRRVLGEIVFTNPVELDKLNNIVWPALLREVKRNIQDTCQVVIIEAAILIKAGWQSECHEVWSTILPRDIAMKRLMGRNNLTETEANRRIDSQIGNEMIVEHSNVVFSSQWGFDFSQQQVRLKNLKCCYRRNGLKILSHLEDCSKRLYFCTPG